MWQAGEKSREVQRPRPPTIIFQGPDMTFGFNRGQGGALLPSLIKVLYARNSPVSCLVPRHMKEAWHMKSLSWKQALPLPGSRL